MLSGSDGRCGPGVIGGAVGERLAICCPGAMSDAVRERWAVLSGSDWRCAVRERWAMLSGSDWRCAVRERLAMCCPGAMGDAVRERLAICCPGAMGDAVRERQAMPSESPGGAGPGPAQRVQCPPAPLARRRRRPTCARRALLAAARGGCGWTGSPARRAETREGLTRFWCPARPAVGLFLHTGKSVNHLCPTRLCIPEEKGLIGFSILPAPLLSDSFRKSRGPIFPREHNSLSSVVMYPLEASLNKCVMD